MLFAYCGLFSLGLYGLYTIVVFFFAMLIRAVVVYRVMSSFSLVGEAHMHFLLGLAYFLFIFILYWVSIASSLFLFFIYIY